MKNWFTHSYMMRVAATAGTILFAFICLTGCGNHINDDFIEEEDESVYHIRFRYDYNMKWADAFSSEVTSVTLYIINAKGNVVLTHTESGDALKSQNYEMKVEVAPGTYTLMAWVGDTERGTFRIPQSTHQSDLSASILPEDYHSSTPYDFTAEMGQLYYGILTNQIFSGSHAGTYVVL